MDEAKIWLTPTEAAEALSVGATVFSQLMRTSDIPVVRLSRKLVRIPAAGLREWASRQEEKQSEPG